MAVSHALQDNFLSGIVLLLPITYSQTILEAIVAKDQHIVQLKQENVLITNERNLLM